MAEGGGGGAWHYLPVWRAVDNGRLYSVVEVHLDDDGALEHWTDSPESVALGENVDELYFDLTAMLLDCMRFEPVEYEALQPGLRFVERPPGEVIEVQRRRHQQTQQRVRRDH